MTTKVKIEITQSHQPVEVQVLYRTATGEFKPTEGLPPARLENIGDSSEHYVHSGAMLEVREVTP